MDGFGLTPEDREKLAHLRNQRSTEPAQPDYQSIEGYEHLEVSQAGKKYLVEYNENSITIPPNRIDQARLSNFIDDYLKTRSFHESHRRNYKSKSTKASQFLPVLEAREDLTDDLSRLADELEPGN